MDRKRVVAVALAALLALALGALLVGACGDDVPDDAVAVVGEVPISRDEFDSRMQQAKASMIAQYGSFPAEGSAEYDAYAADLVDYLVQTQIVEQGAASLGVEVTDIDVSLYIADLEESYGGREAFLEELAESGTTYAEARKGVRESLLGEEVYNAVVEDVKVTAAQVRDFWEENKAALVAQAEENGRDATFTSLKKEIRNGLLEAARAREWQAWLAATAEKLGVRYAEGFDPKVLRASPSPAATGPAG